MPLTTNYHEAVEMWDRIIDDLNKKIATSEDSHSVDCAKDAKRFFGNTRSLFLFWGCDIRVDSGTLGRIQDTTIALPVRATFDDIKFRLHEWRSKQDGRSKYGNPYGRQFWYRFE
jgi:hypothetical protein